MPSVQSGNGSWRPYRQNGCSGELGLNDKWIERARTLSRVCKELVESVGWFVGARKPLRGNSISRQASVGKTDQDEWCEAHNGLTD